MPSPSFNLRLWFAIGSLGTILVICAAAALWLNSYLTESLISRESQVSQEFLEAIVAVNGAAMFTDDGAKTPHQSPALLDFATHTLNIPGILRVNIYATTRRILWSTESKIVGQTFVDNEELDRALTGEIVASMSYLNNDNKAEHVALGNVDHFIEAYMPLRGDAGRGPVAAVMEFYRLPLRLDETLERGRLAIWTGAIAAAALLFGVLYWIVQRGARIIEGQQRQMSLIEAFAAVGQMASAVAHSLRNPMASIRSSAELWQGQLPADSRHVADDIMRDVDRMDSYVRDLLAYARPESYDPRPVDPIKVLGVVVDKHRRAAMRNGVTITVTDGCSGTARVKADDRLLEQALTTIVTNAIEAMSDVGQLAITVTAGAGGNTVRIEVADTGRGIAPDVLQRVSAAYFTTKPGGLGLGLVLTRGIIDRFGGTLTLASTSGVGTTVSLELPAA
jgi:two-component system sensor histidine kinase HydH